MYNCVFLFREYLIKGKNVLVYPIQSKILQICNLFQLYFVWVVLSDRVYWWPDNYCLIQTVPQGSKDEWSHLIAEEARLRLLFGRMVSQRKSWRKLAVPLVDGYCLLAQKVLLDIWWPPHPSSPILILIQFLLSIA